ncbi:chondroitin proteoglycan 1-like [Penaeus vannamei]|uniref:chondroitin proteoglycan 1-like n=1 Tax=Penaeus vannamei TaxID=6689 RepID=UPI00387F88EC
MSEHSSPLKQLAITISMSLKMKSLVLLTALSLLAISEGLEPDLPVKACQEEFSSVSLTSTRLQVSTVVSTVTLLDVVPTYVSVTTTDCVPYATTHTETVSQYQAPQLAYSTHYVTDLKIEEKNRAYTYTSYQQETISITSSATHLEEHVTQVVGTTTATAVSTASLVKTVTASTTATQTYTQVDVFTSVTYLPVYLTTTMTNAWPILKTVYQTEYIKEAVDYVTTVIETSTIAKRNLNNGSDGDRQTIPGSTSLRLNPSASKHCPLNENKPGIRFPVAFVSEMFYGPAEETNEEGLSLAIHSSYRSHLYTQVPVPQIGIKSRHAMSEHKPPG